MKHSILILAMLFFITGCAENENEVKQQENIIIENGIVYHYPSAVDICTYMVKMENNYTYTLQNINKKFKYYNVTLKIYYTKTDKTFACGFAGPLPVINIIKVEKIMKE